MRFFRSSLSVLFLSLVFLIVYLPSNLPEALADDSADLEILLDTGFDDCALVAGPGNQPSYKLRVNNKGPHSALNVRISHDIPANTTFRLLLAPSGWQCTFPPTGGTGSITCTKSSMAAGESGVFLVFVQVISNAAINTQASSTATISSGTSDPNAANNIVTVKSCIGEVGQRPADLALSTQSSPQVAASGQKLTYTFTISNKGPSQSFTAAVLEILIPQGTTFSSVSGQIDTQLSRIPRPGSTQNIVLFIGGVTSGAPVSITLVLNVLAASNSSIIMEAFVLPVPPILCCVPIRSDDTDPADNIAIGSSSIKGGGVVELSWEQSPSTDANPTPAPRNLTVRPGTSAFLNAIAVESEIASDSDVGATATCTLVGYNVYSSGQAIVQITPGNLIKYVPPPSQSGGITNTNATVLPGGSNFAVTAIWSCSGAETESSPSPGVSVPGGPVIDSIEIESKMKINGRNFSKPAEVFIDGIEFKKSAKVKNGVEITQKGKLDDGRGISQLLGIGKTPLLSVRNSNGGISSWLLNPVIP